VRGLAHPREMFPSMSAQYCRFGGGLRLTPCPIRMAIFQERDCACDPFRPLWMPGRGIFDATWIVKYNHRKPRTIADAGRISQEKVSCVMAQVVLPVLPV